MLLSLLVMFWLSPIMAVDSWPCSYEQMIYSVKSHHLVTSPSGMLLNFSHNHPYILHHPCGNHFFRGISPALYLGERLFISLDMFESSILPLTIPNGFTRPPAIVSSAVFGQNSIVAVVNGVVFLYLYATWKRWLHSKGITHPVTELASYKCCFALNDPACDKVNELVLAYDSGNLVSNSEIFYSQNGGYIFESLKSRPLKDGILLGIYVFASSANFGMLLKDASHPETAYFIFGDIESIKNETGTSFKSKFLEGYIIESTLPPGMRGFILLWTNKTFMSSSNDGLTTDIITVLPTDSYPNKTLPERICFAAASSNEFAVLTETQLFYGNLDMVARKMVHLGDKNVSLSHVSCEAMLFENIGMLSIIRPFPSNVSRYYHFQKCIFNIQAKLMTVQPPLQSCPMEILTGDFHNRMYYIDTKQQLHFNATFVPKPGTGAYPYVMLSNPYVLAFEAHIMEDGYTFNGNTKYSLKIKLEEQQLMVEKQNSTLFKKVSSVTVDIYNKGIFCIDMHPLTALIAVDCPPKKHIRILKKTTGCNQGLFEPRLLQNFVYSIDKELYDPLFLGRKKLEQDNLNVTYKYDIWGCPLLFYYDNQWLPKLELWDDNEFVENVHADFVLYEINGMHNYDYLLTEVQANCLSEAQNWIKQLANFPGSPHIAWTKYNYVSCKQPKGNKSLPSVNSKYQVLNWNERNRILFPQYNGFYVFRATIVDRLYSYCDLTTVFSVYIHGSPPKSKVSVGKALISFLVLIFGTMLMVYFFLKLLKEYSRMK
ncbi:LOW QUALITY PROTEIN: cation channel sperm-associated auxiliary subunit delta [Pantherophis guttatus]|uniref:Cation channel sperm-associated auxiliary subunit delta n=1 Tax=Pantherophis guttatus TaxID=94885 RepID=A0A6P9CM90_PANGU|nr:LOW QUALITY PROTEIN: cation channel sperm-associated auxiliary subunit delta [Pantherophis guttatus]